MADRYALVGAAALTALLLTGCSSSGPAQPHNDPSVAAKPGSGTTAPASTASNRSVASLPETIHPASATQGSVTARAISGASVGFSARAAEVYLPPAAREHPTWRFPVLEMLPGTPSAPTDWLVKGNLFQTMNTFAAAHGGRAPVVVMVDINGAQHVDTECIRSSSGGNVESYLASVVPTWIEAHLPVSTNHRQWGVAGLSEGATCSAMLTLRHPATFSAFGDYSGLAYLTLGEKNNPVRTRTKLFGGSQTAYNEHQPLWLLAHHRYPGVSAWFETGINDHAVVADQAKMVAAARKAGVTVHATEIPGKHAWTVWSAALRSSLPWFWTRFGLGS